MHAVGAARELNVAMRQLAPGCVHPTRWPGSCELGFGVVVLHSQKGCCRLVSFASHTSPLTTKETPTNGHSPVSDLRSQRFPATSSPAWASSTTRSPVRLPEDMASRNRSPGQRATPSCRVRGVPVHLKKGPCRRTSRDSRSVYEAVDSWS
jgi:hypothetical protein